MKLVYGKEGPLFVILMILSLLVWAAVIVGTFGVALIVLLFVFIFYLFIHSAYVSHIRGTGVRISQEQFPDLYAQVEGACKKLGMATVPDAYLLNSNGVLNALATRFLWRNFLVLYADIVNALDERPGAVSFYIGHELGHIRRGHLAWGPVLAPGKCFPFIGFAYRRAQEYSCDLHGLACCAGLEDAQRALVVLAAGKRRWKGLNLVAYGQQLQDTSGFWMSFHEITGDYPWLVKRVEHITAVAQNRDYRPPTRNLFAWLPALLVFRAGPIGAMGTLIWIYIIGIVAAIAIPAYQDFLARSQTAETALMLENGKTALLQYYQDNAAWPKDLGTAYPAAAAPAGVGRYTDTLVLLGPSGQSLGILATMKDTGVNRGIAGKTIELWTLDNGASWHCGPGDANPVDAKYLPANCRDEGAP